MSVNQKLDSADELLEDASTTLNSKELKQAVSLYSEVIHAIQRRQLPFPIDDLKLVFHNRACAYALLGDNGQSIDDFERVLSIDPNFVFSLGSIGYVLNKHSYNQEFGMPISASKRRELHDKAITHLTVAINNHQSNYLAYAHRGDVNRLLGRYIQAASDYQKAIAFADNTKVVKTAQTCRSAVRAVIGLNLLNREGSDIMDRIGHYSKVDISRFILDPKEFLEEVRKVYSYNGKTDLRSIVLTQKELDRANALFNFYPEVL